MCGIAGGVFWDDAIGTSRAAEAVSAMVEHLAHRGPDGRGVRCFERRETSAGVSPLVVLGHTRLAIIDLSRAGAQPMGDAAGRCWITYNGETYNFKDLRDELTRAGADFHSGTDTEVLLAAYGAWKLDFLRRLRGMFAFGLWDAGANRLVLARDRLGIKPVYYFKAEGFLLFASEVRALLATGLVPRRLDATGLWQYLGYQSLPAPRTLVEGVRLLEPGQWMTVDGAGHVDQREYWRMLGASASPADVSRDEARRLVGDALCDAVSSHLVSDVPVGAFLSGGIDSSVIVALMRKAGHRPHTFSVGFDEQPFDESSHAALVARTVGAEHTHIRLTAPDLLGRLPDALRAMDQPTGDAVNSYVVSGAVRARGISVALSGLGGDELFGGYPSFARLSRIVDLAPLWGRAPERCASFAARAVRVVGRSSVPALKAAAAIESDGSLSSMFPLTRQLLSRRAAPGAPGSPRSGRGSGPRRPLRPALADAFAEVPSRRRLLAHLVRRGTNLHARRAAARHGPDEHGARSRGPRAVSGPRARRTGDGAAGPVKPRDGTPKPCWSRRSRGRLPDAIVGGPNRASRCRSTRGCAARCARSAKSGSDLAGWPAAAGSVRPQLERLWHSFLDGREERLVVPALDAGGARRMARPEP